MRRVMLVAMVAMLGCASPSVHVVTPSGIAAVDELCRSHPIDAGANVRIDEIARSPSASIHLVQVRGGETPHRHAAHDLTVTMLRGEGTLRIADAVHTVHAGDVTFVPRGVVHWFTRSGADIAVTLAVFSPPLDAPDTVPVGDVDSQAGAR